jgi:hypothetical protein
MELMCGCSNAVVSDGKTLWFFLKRFMMISHVIIEGA